MEAKHIGCLPHQKVLLASALHQFPPLPIRIMYSDLLDQQHSSAKSPIIILSRDFYSNSLKNTLFLYLSLLLTIVRDIVLGYMDYVRGQTHKKGSEHMVSKTPNPNDGWAFLTTRKTSVLSNL